MPKGKKRINSCSNQSDICNTLLCSSPLEPIKNFQRSAIKLHSRWLQLKTNTLFISRVSEACPLVLGLEGQEPRQFWSLPNPSTLYHGKNQVYIFFYLIISIELLYKNNMLTFLYEIMPFEEIGNILNRFLHFFFFRMEKYWWV